MQNLIATSYKMPWEREKLAPTVKANPLPGPHHLTYLRGMKSGTTQTHATMLRSPEAWQQHTACPTPTPHPLPMAGSRDSQVVLQGAQTLQNHPADAVPG